VTDGQKDEEIFSTRNNSKSYQVRQIYKSKND